jgi:large subunit ribosomal protein L6
MSRIGKTPIPIPKDVKIKLDGDLITVKGSKGELKRRVHPRVRVDMDADTIIVSVADGDREARSLHGLFKVLIANMVTGVTKGFEKVLEIVGVGYKAELKGGTVVFSLGYSHPIHFPLPEGVDARIEKTKIILGGIDKQLLGMTASKIRSLKKAEPYKGKGIKYADEVIRRKAGKSGVTGAK